MTDSKGSPHEPGTLANSVVPTRLALARISDDDRYP